MMNKTQQLTERIVKYIKDSLPITSSNGLKLNIDNIKVNIPESNFNIDNQLMMKLSKEGSTEGYISGTVKITGPGNTKIYSGSFQKLITFPVSTDRGTYIVNGVEKNIISQMKMKSGCYTNFSTNGNVKTQLRFDRNVKSGTYMPAISLILNPITREFYVTVTSYRKDVKFNILTFLTLLGFTESEIKTAMGSSSLANAIMEVNTKKKTTQNINTLYKLFFPRDSDGANLSDVQKRAKLFKFFNENARFGDGTVISSTLGMSNNNTFLNKEVITKAVKKTVSVASTLVPEDSKDEVKFKEILNDNDLIFNSIATGFDNFCSNALKGMEGSSSPSKDTILKGMQETISSPLTGSNGLMRSELCVASEETNPLFMEAKSREITQGGPDGMTGNTMRNEEMARNLTSTGINKIDPIETPESGKIGITQHITSNAIIENGTIKSSFYKVTNGKAVINDKNKVRLDPITEENSIVAYNDSKYIENKNGTYVFTQDVAPARYMGKDELFPIKKIQYIDSSRQSFLGTSSNMIPFVGHDDGARALMGAAMQKQAIDLVNKQAPLVTTLADAQTKQTFDERVGEEYGRPIRSTVNGIVQNIDKSNITVVDDKGQEHKYQYYYYYPLNQSFINNEVKVKVGSRVKVGDLLAEGWQTQNGKLSLGRNARIGYIPYKGYNYEDGVVISESFSKAMTSTSYMTKEYLIPKTAKGGRGSNIKSELLKQTTSSALSYFDNDGIAKEGTEIKAGSPMLGYMKELEDADEDDVLDLLGFINGSKGEKKYKYKSEDIPAGSYISGKIIRVSVINNPDAMNKQKVVFEIQNTKPLGIGDKIAGRHGNKGEVTKILPDKLMPVSEDGKPLDIMMSPLAIPSRKNIGQVLECNAGLIAEKTGKRFVVDNFNHKEKDRVEQGLKEIGYPDGKMRVTLKEEDENGNIIDVPVENPITVGNAYILKLKHEADKKIQSRSNNETFLSSKTYMPSKEVGTDQGEKFNPQRLGEMEFRALEGHGAAWNIAEASTIKADGGGDPTVRKALFNALAKGRVEGNELSRSATPETVKVFCDTLQALGCKVKPMYNGREVEYDKPFNSLGIAPLNQNEFIKTIGKDKEVVKDGLFQARQFYDDKITKNKKVDAEFKGGLLDRNIFGTGEPEDRNKWGYIKLPIPTPNPMFMESQGASNIYATLTGIKNADIKSLAAPTTINSSAKAVITDLNEIDVAGAKAGMNKETINKYKKETKDTLDRMGIKEGDLISVKKLEQLQKDLPVKIPFKVGGDALNYLLKKIDVTKELAKAKDDLDKAKKANDIQNSYRKVKALEMLQNNNLKPEDLMVKYVPVMPTYLRPVTPNKKTQSLLTNDANYLYKNVLRAKNEVEKPAVLDSDGMVDCSTLGVEDSARSSKILYDSLKAITGNLEVKKENNKPLKSVFDTLSKKEGLVRKEMLAKREDFSGRTVITVDPTLNLNEIGLPLDMAKNLYKPFIRKELINQGVCKNDREVDVRMKNPDIEVKRVIQQVAKDRPLIANRQPSLHKYSLQALTPVIKERENGGVIRSIQMNPLVITGFNADFDGDQMAAHVPITENAKEEAKKVLMPSQNLINPTDGSMVISIRHEMALGLYQITKHFDKMTGKTIAYTEYKKLLNDYLLGKINYTQRVRVPIYGFETTAGQALFNWCIPDKVKQFRNFKQVWSSKKINGLLMDIYRIASDSDFKTMSKLEIADIFNKLKDLGFKTSTRAGVSLGIGDFKFDKKITNDINKILKSGEKNGVVTNESWKKVEDEIEDKLQKGLLPEDNPLQIMMSSGARANAQQIRKMFATIGNGMDITKKMIEPIKNSLYEGLGTQDYYKLGKDSRKGMYDRSVSTEKPGALTREVWAAVQDVTITEHDCKTKEFINLIKSDKTIIGRNAGKDIISKDGKVICKRNQMITNSIYEQIYKDDTIQYVPVRSVTRCKTPNGKCQMCYGATAGTTQLVGIGTAVGVLASQAIGEPVTQMTMNTFHTGGSNSAATLGLPRVQSILNLSKDPSDKATLANANGVVTDIIELPTETRVMIGKSVNIIKKIPGRPPLTLRVKKGDTVKKGDFLTVGNSADIQIEMNKDKGETKITLSNADPKKLFELKSQAEGQEKALNETRDYFADTMQYAIKSSNAYMDRRHSELIASKLTGTGMIMDSGDSPYMKGQKADINLFERWNEENCTGTKTIDISTSNPSRLVGRQITENVISNNKIVVPKGTMIDNLLANKLHTVTNTVKVTYKPIQYQVIPEGQMATSTDPQNRWFSSLGAQKIKQGISSAMSMGSVDNLQDPASRLMTGKLMNLGDASNYNEKFRNKFTNNMRNFFKNKKNFDKFKK